MPPRFQLKMHWLSTGFCPRADLPHVICFYFVLCIAQNTHLLSSVGAVCGMGSPDLEMQFHSFCPLVNAEIEKKVNLVIRTLQWGSFHAPVTCFLGNTAS